MRRRPLYHGIGYVALVETWGSDERVVESARMSTDGAFRGWGPFCETCGATKPLSGALCSAGCGRAERAGDEKLLGYMHANRHDSPFEFAGMAVEFEAPIFVVRQIQRHRAASYSELSGRYTEMPEAFWTPEPEDVRRQGGSNRQGSVEDESPEWAGVRVEAAALFRTAFDVALTTYRTLLALGVAKEQARAVLPVAQMTRCRMATNLRMWLHFLGLRLDAHAQPETRQLAEGIAAFAREAFPRTLALFDAARGWPPEGTS